MGSDGANNGKITRMPKLRIGSGRVAKSKDRKGERMKENKLCHESSTIPAQTGWELIGWCDGALFSEPVIAWRIETHDCEHYEDGLHIHVFAVSHTGFNSGCDLFAALRDPKGRILIDS